MLSKRLIVFSAALILLGNATPMDVQGLARRSSAPCPSESSSGIANVQPPPTHAPSASHGEGHESGAQESVMSTQAAGMNHNGPSGTHAAVPSAPIPSVHYSSASGPINTRNSPAVPSAQPVHDNDHTETGGKPHAASPPSDNLDGAHVSVNVHGNSGVHVSVGTSAANGNENGQEKGDTVVVNGEQGVNVQGQGVGVHVGGSGQPKETEGSTVVVNGEQGVNVQGGGVGAQAGTHGQSDGVHVGGEETGARGSGQPKETEGHGGQGTTVKVSGEDGVNVQGGGVGVHVGTNGIHIKGNGMPTINIPGFGPR
jgi:hypothetical protein